MFELIINPYGEAPFKGRLCCEAAAETVLVQMPGALSNKAVFLLSGEPIERTI